MTQVKVKLLQKKLVAKDTLALILEKPSGFQFNPGQYINLGLIRPDLPDYEAFRELSLASSPSEKTLMVIFRSGNSIYKQALQTLKLDSDLNLIGPHGYFTLQPDKPSVLLAGGVGIAPFRSMVLDLAQKGFKQRVYLIYSNHDLDEAAFLADFQAVQDPNFTFVPTLTGKDVKSPLGERGYISKELLDKYIQDLAEPTYYLCGTPDMVFDLRMMLTTSGVLASQIRSESFTGY